jgi:hypothetical protein
LTSDAVGWSAPQQMTLTQNSQQDFLTGYNGGMGFSTSINTSPVTSAASAVTWVSPLAVSSDTLAAAAQVGDTLGVIYLQAGRVVGFQPVVTLDTPLIGLPLLATDRARHLYLAWAAPQPSGVAALRFTTTNPDY